MHVHLHTVCSPASQRGAQGTSAQRPSPAAVQFSSWAQYLYYRSQRHVDCRNQYPIQEEDYVSIFSKVGWDMTYRRNDRRLLTIKSLSKLRSAFQNFTGLCNSSSMEFASFFLKYSTKIFFREEFLFDCMWTRWIGESLSLSYASSHLVIYSWVEFKNESCWLGAYHIFMWDDQNLSRPECFLITTHGDEVSSKSTWVFFSLNSDVNNEEGVGTSHNSGFPYFSTLKFCLQWGGRNLVTKISRNTIFGPLHLHCG